MTLSVAIIGAGRMGRFHAANLQRIDGVRIVAVADIQAEQAASLAADVGGDAYTGDGLEMLERVRPDMVYICTSAHVHAESMIAAAGLGINIFVEKPLTTTIADAQRAVDAVERAGVLCTVGYQWRYNPATDAALAALDGLPIALLSGWWYWTIPPIPWLREKRWGGGQIYDQTTHLTDLMRLVAGEATEVYAAYTSNAIPQEALPNWDASSVTLRFAGGAVGSVQCTYALFPGIPENHGLDIAARERMARVHLGQTAIFRPGADSETFTEPAGWSIDHAFIPIVRANDPAAIRSTARDALQSLAVTLAANYSAVTGKVVNLAAFVAHPPTDAPIMPNERPPFTPETTDRSLV
jgi:predicted dehydrogenase